MEKIYQSNENIGRYSVYSYDKKFYVFNDNGTKRDPINVVGDGLYLGGNIKSSALKYEYSDLNKNDITKEVNEASKMVRKFVASKMNLRQTPNLRFIYDESIEYGNRIEAKIKEIHENENREERNRINENNWEITQKEILLIKINQKLVDIIIEDIMILKQFKRIELLNKI